MKNTLHMQCMGPRISNLFYPAISRFQYIAYFRIFALTSIQKNQRATVLFKLSRLPIKIIAYIAQMVGNVLIKSG